MMVMSSSGQYPIHLALMVRIWLRIRVVPDIQESDDGNTAR